MHSDSQRLRRRIRLTNAQRLAEVEAAYTAAETNMLAEKQITLNFYGKSGDVV